MDFSADQFDKLTSGLQHAATCLALAVGGIWTYRRFVRGREGLAKVDLTVDVDVIGRHPQGWLVALIARVENKGSVRHEMKEIIFKVRYLRATDTLTLTEAKVANGEVDFPHAVRTGSWVPRDWGYTWVDPGGVNVYRHVTFIPLEASFVHVYGRFDYKDTESDFHTAVRVVALPSAAAEQSGLFAHGAKEAAGA